MTKTTKEAHQLCSTRMSWNDALGAVVRLGRRIAIAATTALMVFGTQSPQAQETVCVKVKIEIKQELTLERQASSDFDRS